MDKRTYNIAESKSNNRTIVFFARNTSQLKNYVEPYYKEFKELGYGFVVIHTSALTSHLTKYDGYKPEYKIYEISKLNVRKIVLLIKSVAPIAIVSYNFKSMFDILIIRLAAYCCVPSVFVEHGLTTKGALSAFIDPPDKIATIKRYFKYSIKYLQFVLLKGVKAKKEFGILYNAMKRKNYSGAKFSYALLYSKNSLKQVNPFFSFNGNSVAFSGYPVTQKPIPQKEINTSDDKVFLYIHQPFVFHKVGALNYDKEFNYLKEIAKTVNCKGLKFVIKLHPIESIERYKEGLSDVPGIIISDVSDVFELMGNSTIVAGHYSTALFGAVILRKPLFVFDYPGVNEINLLLFNDCGIRIHNNEQLDDLLKFPENYSQKINLYNTYIENVIGSNNNYEHRVKTIIDLINNK